MKKILLVLFYLLVTTFLNANDFVEVLGVENLEYHNHDTYEVWYDTVFKNPAIVVWDLTLEDVMLSEAVNNRYSSSFKKCKNTPKATAYKSNSMKYDKGHMCPNNDRDWSKESAAETFKMCNICPQSAKLNRGSWQKYEKHGHKLAKKHDLVTIVCGPIYEPTSILHLNEIKIPAAFFKVFVIDNEIKECYIFYQDNTFLKTTIDEIEQRTNLTVVIKSS